jgi:hypothetical protein
MSPSTTEWSDINAFGNSSTTGQWQWSDQGMNCTIYELWNYAEVQYCNAMSQVGYSISPDTTTTQPSFFTPVYFAGLNTSPFAYGGIIPIVAIYKINYPAYYSATGATGTGTG